MDYNDIFATTRDTLNDELTQAHKLIRHSINIGHHLSWCYIETAADTLTAYNELWPFDFFVKLKDFKKQYHK